MSPNHPLHLLPTELHGPYKAPSPSHIKVPLKPLLQGNFDVPEAVCKEILRQYHLGRQTTNISSTINSDIEPLQIWLTIK